MKPPPAAALLQHRHDSLAEEVFVGFQKLELKHGQPQSVAFAGFNHVRGILPHIQFSTLHMEHTAVSARPANHVSPPEVWLASIVPPPHLLNTGGPTGPNWKQYVWWWFFYYHGSLDPSHCACVQRVGRKPQPCGRARK